MRTTVEFPVELIRAAKARSAESGESLKALLTRAVAAELEAPLPRRGQKRKVTLPLFGRPSGPGVRLTNADLERALAQEDAARVSSAPSGVARRRPQGRAT